MLVNLPVDPSPCGEGVLSQGCEFGLIPCTLCDGCLNRKNYGAGHPDKRDAGFGTWDKIDRYFDDTEENLVMALVSIANVSLALVALICNASAPDLLQINVH